MSGERKLRQPYEPLALEASCRRQSRPTPQLACTPSHCPHCHSLTRPGSHNYFPFSITSLHGGVILTWIREEAVGARLHIEAL